MIDMFLFSKEHLTILLIFLVFLYICPKLTKNLLPYSYLIEKIICLFILLEIILEQTYILSMGDYNVLTSLPIDMGRFTAYMCIAILFFKNYQLFNVFFSWSLVSSIGELIFFKDIYYRFPDFTHVLYILSKCLLVYANVYMIEVRKFKINRFAIKDNLFMCLIYFSFIYILNNFTSANYCYSFSNYNISSIFIFAIITTIIYIPGLISNNDDFRFKIKRRSK